MAEIIRILGIDPGLANTGWGVIQLEGNKTIPLAYGCLSTSKPDTLPTRLFQITNEIGKVIDRYAPDELSVEAIYFGANTQSAMYTAQARGAALALIGQRNLEYAEYTPMQIKQAVVGTGSADKYQVQYMVRAILGFDHDPKPDHAADALAAAVCHARMRNSRALNKAVQDSLGKVKL